MSTPLRPVSNLVSYNRFHVLPVEEIQDIPHSHETKLVLTPKSDLLVQRLSNHATIPTKGSTDAAGYDLYSAEELVVPAMGKCQLIEYYSRLLRRN